MHTNTLDRTEELPNEKDDGSEKVSWTFPVVVGLGGLSVGLRGSTRLQVLTSNAGPSFYYSRVRLFPDAVSRHLRATSANLLFVAYKEQECIAKPLTVTKYLTPQPDGSRSPNNLSFELQKMYRQSLVAQRLLLVSAVTAPKRDDL
jgi:hypothetical protein